MAVASYLGAPSHNHAHSQTSPPLRQMVLPLPCVTFVPTDKGGAFREDPCLVAHRGFCKPGVGSPVEPRPRLARSPTSPGETHCTLVLPGGPVSLPAPVWFWFFSHRYLFNMENSAVSRGKEPCPAGEHATFPFYHFLFSLSKSEMEDFFPCSFCSA